MCKSLCLFKETNSVKAKFWPRLLQDLSHRLQASFFSPLWESLWLSMESQNSQASLLENWRDCRYHTPKRRSNLTALFVTSTFHIQVASNHTKCPTYEPGPRWATQRKTCKIVYSKAASLWCVRASVSSGDLTKKRVKEHIPLKVTWHIKRRVALVAGKHFLSCLGKLVCIQVFSVYTSKLIQSLF